MVKVSVSIVEAPFAFFKMQVKRMIGHTVELLEASFCKAPKAFNAINMMCSNDKLIAAMFNPKMPSVADIHQTIIATPAVAMNHHFRSDTPPYHRLQTGFRAVRHDLGVDPSIALEKSKDRRLARSATPSFATNTASTKVGLVHFDLAVGKGRFPLASLCNASSDFEVNAVHGFGGQAGQTGGGTGRQIQSE